MKIVVFGASGKVGRLVVDKLLQKNHQVTVFIHKNNPYQENKNLTVIEGSIYDQKDIDKAVKGNSIVISTLGSWNTKKKNILTSGMEIIIPSMRKHNIKRIITITGADAQSKRDRINVTQLLVHFLFGVFARKILIDGERHIQLLESSDLSWTVIRSPRMRSTGAQGSYRLNLKANKPWESIHRINVAEAICLQVKDDKYLEQSPFVHSY